MKNNPKFNNLINNKSMKASIKVTELVCLRVISSDGTRSAAIPLEQTYNPSCAGKGFNVFTDESGLLTVVHHVSSGDCLVLDDKGSIVTDEAIISKFLN